MSKKNNRYSQEFKDEAVRQVLIEGTNVKDLASRLGVQRSQLYFWKEQYLKTRGFEPLESGTNLKEMAQEIAELRKQLAKSQRINEILKKTVVYFGKDEL